MLAWATPHFFIVFLIPIIGVSCQKASLTFVIDDTYSMNDEIAQVLQEVDAIMDVVLDARASQIDNIVLVAFNDDPIGPRLLANTSKRGEFKRILNEINVNGGGYCPEQALSGIKLALESSLPNSYLYVFTDASAKDYYMAEEIKQLLQQKQSRVVFILTGDCENPSSVEYQVYHEIAIASSGMAFRVEKGEVRKLLRAIEEDIRGNKTVLTGKITVAGYYTDVPFTIDDLTESVTVSTSGMNIHLVITGQGCRTDKIVDLDNVKVLKMLDPYPGEYVARIGSATTKSSIVVNANSDVFFKHGFSQQEPKSIDDTAPQPFSDTLTHLSILMIDPRSALRIKSAVIMDMNEHVTETLPLKELWPNFYTTESFIAPSYMFKVGVIGKSAKTEQTIRRIATIPVTPQKASNLPVVKNPIVTIKEGESINVAAGNTVTLTCKVTAYPRPEITWRDDRGLILKSNTSIIQIPYDYISYLTTPPVSKDTRYYCYAKGFRKSKTFKHIDVVKKDPFTVLAVPSGTKKVQYGSEFTLNCNVRADQQFQIRWYHVNKLSGENELITSSDKYTITADGAKLTASSMGVDLVGEYICKVYLSKDPTQKREFTTNLEIYGLEKPVIDPKKTSIKVKENEPATISCKLLKGVPKPKISWLVKAVGATEYRAISGSEPELYIKNAALKDAGDYKCIAKNSQGRTEQVVAEIVVLKNPVTTILEGTTLTVPYGTALTLNCKVTASPKPSVTWYDNAGSALHSTRVEKVATFEYTYRMIARGMASGNYHYHCVATNHLGLTNNTVQVTVTSPFTVHQHPTGTVQAKYGTKVNLKCDITSTMPKKIRWYHTKGSGGEKKEIHSSEKYLISSGDRKLNIKFMDIGLDGKYTCEAILLDNSNEHVELTSLVQLVGLEAPVIKKENNKEALLGTPVVISCNVIKGSPMPTISWQFMGRNDKQYKYLNNINQVLAISKVTSEHFGSYKCIARNNQGTDEHTVALTVEEPPIITTSGEYEAVKGDVALRIPCKVVGYPKPAVNWEVEGSLITPSAKYLILDEALVIKDPVVNDSRSYTCKASNHVGSDSKNFKGIVHAYLPNDGKRVNVSMLHGSSRQLKCNLPRAESASVSWYIGGLDIDYHNLYMNVTDKGNYTCHVSDIYGSATETYEVGYPPKFTFPAKRDVKWYGDTEDVLNCKVDVEIESQVDWTFNGEHLVDKNNTFQLEISKEGHYKCVVSNAYGSVEREFDVKLE